MASHREESLVEAALWMALGRRQSVEVLMHHSDRGSQYSSLAYQAVLAQFRIQVSMSGIGDCYDNDMKEIFLSSLKTECVNRYPYQSHSEPKLSIFEWIEVFYYRQRRHSSLAYLSPVAYEQQQARVSSLYESRGRSQLDRLKEDIQVWNEWCLVCQYCPCRTAAKCASPYQQSAILMTMTRPRAFLRCKNKRDVPQIVPDF
jgi:Integrase core domain